MAHDKEEPGEVRYEQGATEEQNVKIDAIVGDEVLGYEGSARGEHSGQPSTPAKERLTDSLAHNRPDEVK